MPSTRDTTIDVPRPAVWAVIADGDAFEYWVAGCQKIRGVEGSWPAIGASIHHRVGVGALTIADSTSVEEAEPDRRLVLRARVRPLGIARIVLTLDAPDTASTRVVMEEQAIEGPAAFVPDAVLRPLLDARNAETLRRLKRVAETRYGAA